MNKPGRRNLSLWGGLTLILSGILYAAAAGACVICFPYPETTLADRLFENDTVVLVRENARKPYTFYLVDVLKGKVAESTIDVFVDSSSRWLLKQNPKDAAVFGKKNPEAEWRYVTFADIEEQAFIRDIISQEGRWQESDGTDRRIDFFAKRINSDSPLIHEQAYLEVGRAPYSSIKRVAADISREKIRAFLDNWRLVEWHRLYILMLGQSRHPDDRAYIRQNISSAHQFRINRNLSAWVAAFIETNPETGVEEIERLYFSTPDRTDDELKAVLKGLSVLGSESGLAFDADLIKRKRRIVKSYGTLLEHYPAMAGPVAKDLTTWRIRALVKRLSDISQNESTLDAESRFAVNYYLSMASRFPAF